MRITFALPGFPAPIGGFRIVYEYADILTELGHEVTVLHCCYLKGAFHSLSWFRRLIRLFGIVALYIKPRDLSWLVINPSVRMKYAVTLSQRHFQDGDVVVATAWKTAEYIAQLPAQKGKKFYLVQDFAPFMGSENELAASWNLNLKMFTTSAWLLENVRAAAPKAKVIHIPIGLPHATFFDVPDVQNDAKTIAMLYSKGAYKAPEDAIKALEMCREKIPDLQVFFFGKDLPDAAIPGWIIQLGKISKDDLVELYNRTGVFVCSSLGEGLGMPSAEAMLCGAVVATTDTGGNREYALHEKTALVSEIHDPAALAKNILRLVENEQLRRFLQVAGKRKIEQYTWGNAGIALANYFSEVT